MALLVLCYNVFSGALKTHSNAYWEFDVLCIQKSCLLLLEETTNME